MPKVYLVATRQFIIHSEEELSGMAAWAPQQQSAMTSMMSESNEVAAHKTMVEYPDFMYDAQGNVCFNDAAGNICRMERKDGSCKSSDGEKMRFL
jgi:hypothetical protein